MMRGSEPSAMPARRLDSQVSPAGIAALVRGTGVGVWVIVSACAAPPSMSSSGPPRAAVAASPPHEPKRDDVSDGGAESPPALAADAEDWPSVPARLPAADKDQPVAASFGMPLPPGLYTFPDGLRLRFSAAHECEYDSTAPCSPWDVSADFKGRQSKLNIFRDKVYRIAGHSIELVNQELVVRK